MTPQQGSRRSLVALLIVAALAVTVASVSAVDAATANHIETSDSAGLTSPRARFAQTTNAQAIPSIGSATTAAIRGKSRTVSAAPTTGSGSVQDRIAATQHTGDDFLAIFDEAYLPGLGTTAVAAQITGNLAVDARIRALAKQRGYRRRPEAAGTLTRTDGFFLQPRAASAWEDLQASAADAGLTIRLRSGYRSVTQQGELFRKRIAGTSDTAINRVLARVAPPGYSKHHTGYAIDIGSPHGGGFDFAHTDEYAWLAADNFAVAKIHGFIPSYPYGTGGGPDPEPWEFVWVGAANIVCKNFEPSAEERFCDAISSPFIDDIEWLYQRGITTGCTTTRYCTTDAVTRAEVATFLWRLLGKPLSTAAINFDDVPDDEFYTEAIRWMAENGFTNGTSSSRFSPHNPITREQLFTLLWRIAGRPAVTGGFPLADTNPLQYSAPALLWAVREGLTALTEQATFLPTSPVDREAVAEVIRRYKTLPRR